jgi:hypothetical protein
MRSRLPLVLFWTTVIAFHGGSAAGQMITSDRDPRLAINAWDGAQHGTVLRLHDGCRPDNPDCTWHLNNGMITSDRDPRLAINAWDGAQHGTVLRLHDGCRPDNPDCTWQAQLPSAPPRPVEAAWCCRNIEKCKTPRCTTLTGTACVPSSETEESRNKCFSMGPGYTWVNCTGEIGIGGGSQGATVEGCTPD